MHCYLFCIWLYSSKSTNHIGLQEKINLYRTLQVLNAVHNECCSTLMWPTAQYLLMIIHVILNVLMIKLYSVLPISLAIVLLIGSVEMCWFEKGCFKAAADIYNYSHEFKSSIVGRRRTVTRAVGRSLRCLRVEVGPQYFIKVSTVTRYWLSVYEYTINVILAFS